MESEEEPRVAVTNVTPAEAIPSEPPPPVRDPEADRRAEAEAARPATRCTIMQLTSRTCRWPLWGKERLPVEKRYYCGETVAAGVPGVGSRGVSRTFSDGSGEGGSPS